MPDKLIDIYPKVHPTKPRAIASSDVVEIYGDNGRTFRYLVVRNGSRWYLVRIGSDGVMSDLGHVCATSGYSSQSFDTLDSEQWESLVSGLISGQWVRLGTFGEVYKERA